MVRGPLPLMFISGIRNRWPSSEGTLAGWAPSTMQEAFEMGGAECAVKI